MSVLKNNLDLELVEIINSLENDKLLVTSYKTHSENLEDINQVQTLWIESGTESANAN